MVDVSTDLAKKVQGSLLKALQGSVSLTGKMSVDTQKRLAFSTDGLRRSLRNYDRVADGLVSKTPSKSQLDKVIQERVPPDYANKAYKKLFWRSVYKTVPFLTSKRKTEEQINALSKMALSVFHVLYDIIAGVTKSLIEKATVVGTSGSDLTSGDPDTFDPELSSTLSGLEKEVKPPEGLNQQQRRTDKGLDRKLKKKNPVPTAPSPEDFSSAVSEHNSKVDGARSSVSRHASALTKCLTWSTPGSFSLIQESATHANRLAQALDEASRQARDDLQPGTYIACKSVLAAILATNAIVIKSVALNRTQRSEINESLRKLQKKHQKQNEDR